MLLKVRAHCPLCDHDFEVHRRYLGMRVRCRKCWKPISVPADAPQGSSQPPRLTPAIADSPVRERLLNGPTWLRADAPDTVGDDRFAVHRAQRHQRFAAQRDRRAQVVQDRQARRDDRRDPQGASAGGEKAAAPAPQDFAAKTIVAEIAAELVAPEKTARPRGDQAGSRTGKKGFVRCRFCRQWMPDHRRVCPHCGKTAIEPRTGAPRRLPWARAVFVLALVGPFTGGCLSLLAIPLSIKVLQNAKNHQGAVGIGYAVAALVIAAMTLLSIGPLLSEVMNSW